MEDARGAGSDPFRVDQSYQGDSRRTEDYRLQAHAVAMGLNRWRGSKISSDT